MIADMKRKLTTNQLGYVCDFETLSDNEEYTYIWAWASSNIEFPEQVKIGNTMESFIEWCKDKPKLYFHNLSFDGAFIIDWLFRNGFKYAIREKRDTKTFNILKSDDNKLYSIDITWTYTHSKKFTHTVIQDSFKKLPFSVEKIADSWNLPISKLEIDYKQHREYGQELTEQEKAYIQNDVKIVAYALKSLLEDGNNKMTIGADALSYFKGTKSKAVLNKLMPKITLEQDSYFRKAYKGGFTYVNPLFQDKDIGEGIVFDVNSLYPSRMYFCSMPYGEPVYYSGGYIPNKNYPLYIQHVRMKFTIKPNHIPCIQLKNNMSFVPTEYVNSSGDEIVDLWLSSVDYELIKQQYDIIAIDYVDGYMFKACDGVFNEYIEHFMEIKKTHTGAKRQEAKLFLNNLYGKLATNPVRRSKYAYYDETEDIVKYSLNEEEVKEPMYIPMGVFITAYARYMTITSAQKLYHRFIYADTDSLHLIGTEIPDCLEVDDKELGKWAHESTFTRARFIRPKTYIEEINGKLCVTCAGLPAYCHTQVTWENFKHGAVYYGKLRPKTVKGGIILKETTFNIK